MIWICGYLTFWFLAASAVVVYQRKHWYRKVDFRFALYDGWVGFFYKYWDKELYICPLPFCVFTIDISGLSFYDRI
jgi:hypothetical protein